jgi:hypothetical protein
MKFLCTLLISFYAIQSFGIESNPAPDSTNSTWDNGEIIIEIDYQFPSDYYFSYSEDLGEGLTWNWDFGGGQFIEITDDNKWLVRYFDDKFRYVSLTVMDGATVVLPETSTEGFHPSIHDWIEDDLEKINFGTVDIGDYNNDNYPDILATGSNKTLILKNCNGDSTVTLEGITIEIDFSCGKWTDYNNDNNLDFIVAGQQGDSCICDLYKNQGNDVFVKIEAPFIGVSDPDIRCYDFNNDGWEDIIIAGANTDSIPVTQLYKNSYGSFIPIESSIMDLKKASINIADIDMNGFKDVFIQGRDNADQRHTQLYYYNGSTYTPSSFNFQGLNSGSFAFTDIDFDGDLDIAMSGFKADPIISGNSCNLVYSSYMAILENQNNDNFSVVKQWQQTNTFGRSSLNWGDYDNDGDMDLYANGTVGGITLVVVGVGGPSGTFDMDFSCMSRVYQNEGNLDFIDTEMDIPCIRNDVNGATIYFGYQSYSSVLTDFNLDNRVDFIRTGSGTEVYNTNRASIYTNGLNTENTPPNPPQNLYSEIINDSIKLHWEKGLDNQHSSHLIETNYYLKDNFDRLYKSPVNKSNTYLDNSSIAFPGPGLYYWSARHRDGAYSHSIWAEEQSMLIPHDEFTVCDGDSVLIYDQYRYTDGYYYDTISSVEGYDSLLITRLNVLPLPELYLSPNDTIVCPGSMIIISASGSDNYLWSTGATTQQIHPVIETPTTFSVTTVGSNNCSSSSTVFVDTYPSDTNIIYDHFCENDSYTFNGSVLEEEGIYYYDTQSIHGCDSIVELHLSEMPTFFTEETESICEGDVLSWHNQTYSETGVYYDSLLSITDCDSIYCLNLTVLPSYENTEFISACNEYYWAENNVTYYESGIYTETYPNAYNCDSILILDLEIITLNMEVTQQANILTANMEGISYQWIDCDNNFEPITGETNQSFEASENGSYAVILTTVDCSDTTDCYPVTGIETPQYQNQPLSIYPNPGDGIITIKPDKKLLISIYSIDGKQILRRTLSSGEQPDLTQEPDGMYLINIISDREVKTIKYFKYNSLE